MRLSLMLFLMAGASAWAGDWRNIRNGFEIPTANYADQPYIVKTDDGAWLCVVTTGAGHEGQPGQHVVSMRSTDLGRTWSAPVAVEPATGPEASYAVLLKVPSGRVYVFYNHNTDNLREAKADDPPYKGGVCKRVDSLGYFVFKYTDDHGQTWSGNRHPIPVREMEIDRTNPYGGEVRYFWNVGKPFVLDKAAYVPLHKVGGLGYGFFTRSEGVFLRSPNLLFESDPEHIEWETLPEGESGLRTPAGGGPIAEEQSVAVLSDGSLYCVYRSIDGHPVFSISRDCGRTWSAPEYQRYADGRLMKHPRAANFLWKCSNGKYLYWFHNHGGRFIGDHPRPESIGYNDRNPVFLCAGVERETAEGMVLDWSQPEIVLYDPDPAIRMSYPDFVEEGTRCFFTETQKDVARVHEVPREFLEKLWAQFEADEAVRDGLILERSNLRSGEQVPLPKLPAFAAVDRSFLDARSKPTGAGVTVDVRFRLDRIEPGAALIDNRTPEGKGFALLLTDDQGIEWVMNDGRTESRWRSEPGWLGSGRTHHATVVVDGGPSIVSFVVDGLFQDGGEARQFGWGRFSPHLRDIEGGSEARILPGAEGELLDLRFYDRALMTSEAVANHRAGG